MHRNWTNGILGIWLIMLAFLGLPSDIKSILIVITGVILALGYFSREAGSMVSMAIEKEGVKGVQERKSEKETKEIKVV